jgi:hypothetical protein
LASGLTSFGKSNRVKITNPHRESSAESLQTIATICNVMYSKVEGFKTQSPPYSPQAPRSGYRVVKSRGKAASLLGNPTLVFAGALWALDTLDVNGIMSIGIVAIVWATLNLMS